MLSTGDGCRASALTWLIFDMMRFAVRGDNAGQLFTIREQTASCYTTLHICSLNLKPRRENVKSHSAALLLPYGLFSF